MAKIEITNKSVHDPVADLKLVDAYVLWALLAAEEVTGKQGLHIALRDAGLERLIDHYPPDETKTSGNFTFGDYANLSAGLMNFYGRAGKSMLLRIGRLSCKHAIERQGAVFGLAATLAAKVLPIPVQLKMSLENMQKGFRALSQSVGEDMRIRLEDRGNKLAYIAEDCAMCAGKQANAPICLIHSGVLQEGARWLSGKEFEIEEVECRAMGAPACVWEINKQSKE